MELTKKQWEEIDKKNKILFEKSQRDRKEFREYALTLTKKELWERFAAYLYAKCEATAELLSQGKVVVAELYLGKDFLPVCLIPWWESTGEANFRSEGGYPKEGGYIIIAIMQAGGIHPGACYPVRLKQVGKGLEDYLETKLRLDEKAARDLILYLMTLREAFSQMDPNHIGNYPTGDRYPLRKSIIENINEGATTLN